MTDTDLIAEITDLGGQSPKRAREGNMETLAFEHRNQTRRFGVTGAGDDANEALLMAAEHGCFSARIPISALRAQ